MHFIVILVAVLMAGLPALAQPKWAQGQSYSGNIDIGGVQVPLPAGEWVVTGFDQATTTGADAGAQSNIGLAQIIDGKLRAYMSMSYNQRAVSNGWTVPASKNCVRSEIHHAVVVRDRQLDKACTYVNHYIFTYGETSPKWWKDTIAYAKEKSVAIPPTVIQSGIVVSDRSNFLSLAYYFNPEAKGFTRPRNISWQGNDWSVLNIAADEKKSAFVQSIIDWTEKARPVVEAGLAGKLKKGEGFDWPTAMQ